MKSDFQAFNKENEEGRRESTDLMHSISPIQTQMKQFDLHKDIFHDG
jgi:hypothetical protein